MEFKVEDDDCAFHIGKNPLCVDSQIFQKIKKHEGIIKSDKDTIYILKSKYGCMDDVCVLKNMTKIIGPDEVEKIILENFKPKGPKNTNAWLSNFEIDEVLDQFAKKYKDRAFYHVPFQMIDFEETKSELALLNWPKLYKQHYRTFGSVINTDHSAGGGKHWFAIFGDFSDDAKEYTIEYFNSSGELPMNQIIYWAKKVQTEWRPFFDRPIKFVIVTRAVNQKDNHSCGPYSIYYIVSRLSGIPYSHFKYNMITDTVMHKFRQFLFRN